MRRIKVKLLEQAEAFLLSLPLGARAKFNKIIRRVREGDIDPLIFKKLKNHDFYEFRVFHFPNQYRIFAFWDEEEDSLIIGTHGIIKKDQEIRNKEFKTMEKLRKEYYQSK